MTPKSISVIINTYNRRQSLAITLRSLAWLDYPHFEVIVVNGPSADDTEDFLNAFSGNMKVGSCENRNLSESRNVGVQMASGEIVAFIDDDAIPIPAGSMQLTTCTICQKLGQPVVRWLDIRAMTSRPGTRWRIDTAMHGRTSPRPSIQRSTLPPPNRNISFTPSGRTVHFGEIFSSRWEDLTKSSSTTSKRPTCVAASPTRDTSFGRSMRDSCTTNFFRAKFEKTTRWSRIGTRC